MSAYFHLSPTRTVLWQRLNAPGLERCSLILGNQGPMFDGHVIAALDGRPIRVEYMVECDTAWATYDVSVRCFFADASISSFQLCRDDESHWKRFDQAHPADATELPEVAGCIDVDLGITPATNTLPIRRLNLAAGESAEVTAAWIRFPDLSIEPLHQRYTRLDANRYRYESDTGFSAELTVDDQCLVVTYAGGWERVATEDHAGV
jgi:hypothetical protein